MAFDKWTLLKVFEVGFVIASLICKRVTDDEASRLFLYLQKLSREWSLLNNVTWDKLGAAVADTTYGGYVIITVALLIGRITGELPTARRITEMVLLGVGALLFVVLGSLEFAALDSVPPDLVDNAAVLGSLSLITAALFLLDLGGPKDKKEIAKPSKVRKKVSKPSEVPNNKQDVYTIEPEMQKIEREELEAIEEVGKKVKLAREQSGYKDDSNGHGPKMTGQNGYKNGSTGYKRMKERESSRRFDIYGKDADNYEDHQTETDDKHNSSKGMEEQSPVWSQIRKGQYGKYDVVVPAYLYPQTESVPTHHGPSGPGDPGYVQYTAKRWGQPSQKTPRHSPTQFAGF